MPTKFNLEKVIKAARPGQTIKVPPGVYEISELIVPATVRLIGAGQSK